ncbi:unnamed protein product [Clavelina lepadiformis]|uniref:Uncharacterized protein n=1 Tax=Clavelina lepadiformis TaxID=159417 RepID=A0ABP0G9F1_CLALP
MLGSLDRYLFYLQPPDERLKQPNCSNDPASEKTRVEAFGVGIPDTRICSKYCIKSFYPTFRLMQKLSEIGLRMGLDEWLEESAIKMSASSVTEF